ncbi:MAG: UbiX family flavin prenyltransferase, partial [Candidatus Aenigmatarchaeota archaeon]
MKRIIVGISGASGSILGIRLLQELGGKAETHLIITETARKILEHETGFSVRQVENFASRNYDNSDLFSPVASGSFKTEGMVVIPCSMKTLAGIASGFSYNLLLRCADVCLKERRRLVLVVRETPLSKVHIRNMKIASDAGAVILPPVLSFYSKP